MSRIEIGPHGPPIVETPAGLCVSARWASEADTQAFACRLAACPALAHATLALGGELGAGKTTLVRHLLRALGVRGRIKSPTYAVLETHSAIDCPLMPPGEPLLIWHFDLYRFSDPREWEDAGFHELFASPGLKLVEWPQRAAGCMPIVDAHIDIQPDALSAPADSEGSRQVCMTAHTATGRLLLAELLA